MVLTDALIFVLAHILTSIENAIGRLRSFEFEAFEFFRAVRLCACRILAFVSSCVCVPT